MPIEITVGPPVLTINQGSTFVVSEHSGNMRADSEHGLFASDTRFVSYWAVFANGMPWTLLTCSPVAYYAARVNLTNPAFPAEDGDVPEGALHLTIGRSISRGVHEDLDVTNYGMNPVRFNLEVALRCDFADLFEVKSHNFVRRGRIVSRWDEKTLQNEIIYANRDFRRSLV